MNNRETDTDTVERAFTFDLIQEEPVSLRPPQAPGFIMTDESDEAQRKVYSDRFDALERALLALIDDFPFTAERFELTCDYDRFDGCQCVRLMNGSVPLWEARFYCQGIVRFQDPPDSEPLWSATTWREGLACLMIGLRIDAELDMRNAAQRLEKLAALKIE